MTQKIKGEDHRWTPAEIVLTVPDNVYHFSKVLNSKQPQFDPEAFEYPSLMTVIKASIDPGKQAVGWVMTKPLMDGEYEILTSRVTVTDSYGHNYAGQVTHKNKNPESPGVEVPKGGYFRL